MIIFKYREIISSCLYETHITSIYGSKARKNIYQRTLSVFNRYRDVVPEDLSEEDIRKIFFIYLKAFLLEQKTGELYHVDHIKSLSHWGLHIPSNLQVLPAKENLQKG